MESKIIWDILSNTSAIATIEATIKEVVSDGKGAFGENNLRKIDTKMKEKVLKDIKEPILEEELDKYITEHASGFKTNIIFPYEEKQDFIEDFLNKHLELLPYKETVESVLECYLEELEKSILKIMTGGQAAIFRVAKETNQEVKSISERMGKMAEDEYRKEQESSKINMANDMYCRSFSEPLFLHKNEKDTKVRLKNLFILQKYYIIRVRDISEKRKDLSGYIEQFLMKEIEHFFFIEGDAGCGKSSLVSFLNYHYKKQDEIGKRIFHEKKLITVRLRDMPINQIKKTGDFVQGILDYLRVKSVRELEQMYPNAVLLLDGFDELCLVEGMWEQAENYIYDLNKFRNYKIIITTRPRYIKIYSLDVAEDHILLDHLDEEQRDKWIQKYEGICGQTVDCEKKEFLSRITEEDAYGICDTPMALYMLVAGKISREALCNEWALYHQIFYNELSETEYNQMFPNENYDYEHDIMKYRDTIYQVSEEIAYQMYCNGNSQLYLLNDELGKIVEKVGIDKEKTKAVVERCYALCGYWKADTERGMVEFYHNNMRDFFLCESVMRKMNEIYKLWCVGDKHNLQELIKKLCVMFQYGDLETMVCKFILLRTMYKNVHGELDEFYDLENRYRKLPELMQYLLTKGDLYAFSSDRNLVDTVCNVLSCIVQVYRHIYEPMLKENERIKWWDDVHVINASSMLRYLFKLIFIKVPVTLSYDSNITLASRGNFSNMDLQGSDLRNAGFSKSSLGHAVLNDAILKGCDFADANLRFAELENADLHYVKFVGADMRECDLRGSEIRDCDFADARLEGAILPDRFSSPLQEKQLKHMRELGYI